MRDELEIAHRFDSPLPQALLDTASDGFEERDGCYVLRRLTRIANNVSMKDFPDRTGYECFVNSVHIDDHVIEDYLTYAFIFADALISVWKALRVADRLGVIVSSDEYGAVVKGHVARPGESWLALDLDGYGEAILVADSSFEGKLATALKGQPS